MHNQCGNNPIISRLPVGMIAVQPSRYEQFVGNLKGVTP